MLLESSREGQALFAAGLLMAAKESMERWVELARREHPEQLCAALNCLGSLLLQLNRLSDALLCFQESTALSAANPHHAVRSLSNLSLCHYLSGAAAESARSGEAAYATARMIGDLEPRVNLHVHMVLGLSYIGCARWEEARRVHEEALRLARRFGDPASVARVRNNLGLILIELGEYDAAEEHLLAALRCMEALKKARPMAYTLTELGRLHLKRGDLARALHYGSFALRTLWENMGAIDKAEVARLCELFGSVAHATGDRRGAVDYLQRAVTYYGQQERWREWESAVAQLNAVLQGPAPQPGDAAAIDRREKELLRYFTALLGLMDALECLHPHLQGKAELVTKYAALIGSELGLPPDHLERLAHAARLHDVGLTCVEEGDRTNAGARPEGLQAVIGERLLRMFDAPEEVCSAVRHHRERFDGLGGPDGLQGEEIPLFSRIIAVAEGYVRTALGCEKSGRAHTEALAYVRARAGTEYDPHIVSILVDVHERCRTVAHAGAERRGLREAR